ncbi:MAG: hypothetical protein BWY36_00129 [Candidatus Diapherotrites archaeon ADurb.Bin253]|nr:MAG: hypothetical protein BWY36_00129 [Candidatus Diapherotrites archaeon ADurb.Bin253]
MVEKKGEMQIGFGMIFSIFLIIAFIAFAIYGVSKFLCVNKMAQIESFKNDFQNDINKMYKSTSGSQSVSYVLPKKIKQVCFIDDEYSNVYFVPKDIGCQIEGEMMIKNIDITKTISDSRTRPKKLCIDAASGKITMVIKKSYNEAYVTITK